MKLSPREIATAWAALSYWQEEMLPHRRRIMSPYFRPLGLPLITPLNRLELERLLRRLRSHLRPRH